MKISVTYDPTGDPPETEPPDWRAETVVELRVELAAYGTSEADAIARLAKELSRYENGGETCGSCLSLVTRIISSHQVPTDENAPATGQGDEGDAEGERNG